MEFLGWRSKCHTHIAVDRELIGQTANIQLLSPQYPQHFIKLSVLNDFNISMPSVLRDVQHSRDRAF